MKISILAILLMVSIAGADGFSVVLSTSNTLAGPNCRDVSVPTSYDVMVAVSNPSTTSSLRVTSKYYNSSLGDFEDGGKVCYIQPGARQSCTFPLYTVTGGQNKTENIPMKIIGDNGKYEATVEVSVNHYTGIFEQNVMAKLDTARAEYQRVIPKFSGCYNESAFSLMQDANSSIATGDYNLAICNLQGAQNLATDAINKIRTADSSPKPESCNQPPANNTQPPLNNTQNQTQNQTHQNASQQQTNSSSSTSNLTKITSAIAKGCMPFAILLTLLVIAVWSERK